MFPPGTHSPEELQQPDIPRRTPARMPEKINAAAASLDSGDQRGQGDHAGDDEHLFEPGLHAARRQHTLSPELTGDGWREHATAHEGHEQREDNNRVDEHRIVPNPRSLSFGQCRPGCGCAERHKHCPRSNAVRGTPHGIGDPFFPSRRRCRRCFRCCDQQSASRALPGMRDNRSPGPEFSFAAATRHRARARSLCQRCIARAAVTQSAMLVHEAAGRSLKCGI